MAGGYVLHHPAVEVEYRRRGASLAQRPELDAPSVEPGTLDLNLDALFLRMGDPHRTALVLLEIRDFTGKERANALGDGAVEMAQLDAVHRADRNRLFCPPLRLICRRLTLICQTLPSQEIQY
jgi:hypothetical protein